MNLGVIFTILSALLYGSIGYFGTTLRNQGLTVLDACFWRFLISAALFLPFLPRFLMSKLEWKSVFHVFILGAVFYSSSTYLYFYSSQTLGTGLAMVIFYTYPIYVVLISSFLTKQMPSQKVWFALGLLLVGCSLIAYEESIVFDTLGIGCALLSALAYGIYVAISKQTGQKVAPLLGSFLVCLGNGAAFFVLIPLMQHQGFYVPHEVSVWTNILLFALIGTVLPVLLLLYGMKTIAAGEAAILSVLEPVMVLVVGYLVLNEEVSLQQGVGALVILSSAVIISLQRRETEAL